MQEGDAIQCNMTRVGGVAYLMRHPVRHVRWNFLTVLTGDSLRGLLVVTGHNLMNKLIPLILPACNQPEHAIPPGLRLRKLVLRPVEPVLRSVFVDGEQLGVAGSLVRTVDELEAAAAQPAGYLLEVVRVFLFVPSVELVDVAVFDDEGHGHHDRCWGGKVAAGGDGGVDALVEEVQLVGE